MYPAGVRALRHWCMRLGLTAVIWPGLLYAQQLRGDDESQQLAQARAAVGKKAWEEAERRLREYLSTQPGSTAALYLLATTLFHEDKPRASLAMFTQAAQAKPPSAADLRTVALDYVLLDDYEDADKWITRSAQEPSPDAETWYVMGRIKYSENRFSESVDCFRKVLVLEQHSVRAENNLGLALEGLDRPLEAMAAYRRAIAYQAQQPQRSEQPLLNLGILLANSNQPDEALKLLLEAEKLAPQYGKTHSALGRLYARRGDLAEAQKQMEQAVAESPNDYGLRFQLGQVYRRQGKTEQAASEFERAARLEAEQRKAKEKPPS